MKRILKSSLMLAIVVAVSSLAAGSGHENKTVAGIRITGGDPVIKSSGVIVPVDPAVDENGNPIADPVVYNSFCNPINPIVAPDGHLVTFSEWVHANGS